MNSNELEVFHSNEWKTSIFVILWCSSLFGFWFLCLVKSMCTILNVEWNICLLIAAGGRGKSQAGTRQFHWLLSDPFLHLWRSLHSLLLHWNLPKWAQGPHDVLYWLCLLVMIEVIDVILWSFCSWAVGLCYSYVMFLGFALTCRITTLSLTGSYLMTAVAYFLWIINQSISLIATLLPESRIANDMQWK